jgi:FkbM family methyltransferase
VANVSINHPAEFLVSLTRRWKHRRLVRASAYRIGEALGDRVLLGKTPGGSPMILSMRDHQHRAIYFHGEHEPDITALFRRLVKPGWTVFDVGANAGYFSILAAELGAEVHAFEPNPSVRELLTRSVRLGSSEIEVVPAACSDHEARLPLFLSDPGNTGMSSLGVPTERHVEVDVITLEAYSRGSRARPDLLKIDVEGHEREVLAGASSLLASARPIVIAETGDGDTIELMHSYAYEPMRILGDGTTVAHDGRLKLVGGYENICFMPSPTGPTGVASQFTTSELSTKAERENGPKPVTVKTS